jgi:hypothetical protein
MAAKTPVAHPYRFDGRTLSSAGRISVSPRPVFDPRSAAEFADDPVRPAWAEGSAPAPTRAAGYRSAIARGAAMVVGYYRDPLAWLTLAVTSIMLCYVGGAAMFWFHAIHLREGGPAIAWYYHWLLDSSFGFLVLTPALAVLMPFAAWSAGALTGRATRLVPWIYTVVCGGLFAGITTPGPVAHDLMVGRGTWIANHVTAIVGNPGAAPLPHDDYPRLAQLTQQLGAGIPLYIALTGLVVWQTRVVLARRSVTVAQVRIA